MERPTVFVISDQAEFAHAIINIWQNEPNSPFLSTQNLTAGLSNSSFDLAIVGISQPDVLNSLRAAGKPIIHVFQANEGPRKIDGVLRVPRVEGWPEVVITLSKQILEHERTVSEIARLGGLRSKLEREATLGRYILEMRHSLNNALTSILGNSELMLLEPETLSPAIYQQIEIIRNMGMRMNEILQRFSSLQKEMQIAEQQVSKKSTKAAAASA